MSAAALISRTPSLALPVATRTPRTTERLDPLVTDTFTSTAASASETPKEGPSRLTRVLLGAAAGAVYGAAVGSGTTALYAALGLSAGTVAHMGLILGGGAINTPIIGKVLEPKVDKPSNYVLGAFLGAGVTWGTSAFGLMGNPVVGAVGGGLAGAFYGGLLGALS